MSFTNTPKKYDNIGSGYDSTRQADPYLESRIIHHLQPTHGKKYLDMGCGTGNYTNALSRHGFQFIGVDPSEKMLAEARLKNSEIQWVNGSAENNGLANNDFDGIVATLTMHHWSNLELGVENLFRIAKPGAKLVVFTSTPEQTGAYWLKEYFPKMIATSSLQLPSLDRIVNALRSSGFTAIETEIYEIKDDLKDLFLNSGKNNPSLYLNESVRKGISSFAALANSAEVEIGLHRLRIDIETGVIMEVIKRHQNDIGDYLFIIARKP